MVTDITDIDLVELLQDREDSLADIAICEIALMVGVTEWSGGTVQQRLEANKRIVEKIDEELNRRGNVQIITPRPEGE